MVPNAMPIFTNICQIKGKDHERKKNRKITVMVVAEIMVAEEKRMKQ